MYVCGLSLYEILQAWILDFTINEKKSIGLDFVRQTYSLFTYQKEIILTKIALCSNTRHYETTEFGLNYSCTNVTYICFQCVVIHIFNVAVLVYIRFLVFK
jgi:hypothetical protein